MYLCVFVKFSQLRNAIIRLDFVMMTQNVMMLRHSFLFISVINSGG